MERLKNTDFKKLLNKTDQDVLGNLSAAKKKKSSQAIREKHKQRHLQVLKRQKPRHEPVDDEPEEAPTSSNWRDRAAERRKGDYAQVTEEYKLLRDKTEEESKFLGGDVEHTHLVKGLDYVLLAKVRSEIEKKAEAVTPDVTQPVVPPEKTKGSTSNPIARNICHELVEQVHPHHVSFQKKLERIDSVVLRGAQFRGNTTNFQSGKMRYVFDVSQSKASTVPIVVFQSAAGKNKSNAGESWRGVVAPVHQKILKSISEIILWKAQNSKSGKRRQQEPIPAAPVSERPADDDEDIFGGVGGYDPSSLAATAEDSGECAAASHSYFERVDEPEIEEDKHAVSVSTIRMLAGKADSIKSKGQEKGELLEVVDDYGECYPTEDVSFGAWGADSDDEVDGKKKRKKGQKADEPTETKKPKLTARAAKRQAEREWKQIEDKMESKSSGLDAMETAIKKNMKGNTSMNIL